MSLATFQVRCPADRFSSINSAIGSALMILHLDSDEWDFQVEQAGEFASVSIRVEFELGGYDDVSEADIKAISDLAAEFTNS